MSASPLAIVFIPGALALVPLGVGAWLHSALAPPQRRLVFIGALATACVAGFALWSVLTFIYAHGLRFQTFAGALLCAAMASSLAAGIAAASFWKRGAWHLRIVVIVPVLGLMAITGFEIVVLAIWSSERGPT